MNPIKPRGGAGVGVLIAANFIKVASLPVLLVLR
jgi:hypothetical protein